MFLIREHICNLVANINKPSSFVHGEQRVLSVMNIPLGSTSDEDDGVSPLLNTFENKPFLFPCLSLSKHSNVVSDCSFTNNGHFLCTASWDKTLKLWDLQAGGFRSHGGTTLQRGHEGSVSSCSFSADGETSEQGSAGARTLRLSNETLPVVFPQQACWCPAPTTGLLHSGIRPPSVLHSF